MDLSFGEIKRGDIFIVPDGDPTGYKALVAEAGAEQREILEIECFEVTLSPASVLQLRMAMESINLEEHFIEVLRSAFKKRPGTRLVVDSTEPGKPS